MRSSAGSGRASAPGAGCRGGRQIPRRTQPLPAPPTWPAWRWRIGDPMSSFPLPSLWVLQHRQNLTAHERSHRAGASLQQRFLWVRLQVLSTVTGYYVPSALPNPCRSGATAQGSRSPQEEPTSTATPPCPPSRARSAPLRNSSRHRPGPPNNRQNRKGLGPIPQGDHHANATHRP